MSLSSNCFQNLLIFSHSQSEVYCVFVCTYVLGIHISAVDTDNCTVFYFYLSKFSVRVGLLLLFRAKNMEKVKNSEGR
jgi:hypothetical protein